MTPSICVPGKEADVRASYNLAEDFRLNLEDFSVNDQVEFAEFVEMSKSKKDGPDFEKPEENNMATLIQSMQNVLSQKDPITGK